MGVSTSPAQLAAKIEALAVALNRGDDLLVVDAAKVAKGIIKAGAPGRLRGVGKHGATLNVRYTVSTSGDSPAALVFATGPWQLIERDTRPHQIPRQRSYATFEGVYGHAVVPGGSEAPPHGKRGVRTRVGHPGTKGKAPWRKGVERAITPITRVFRNSGERVIGAIF